MRFRTLESRRGEWGLLVLLLASAVGCGPAGALPGEEELASRKQRMVMGNGLNLNGLNLNGLNLNGLNLNGLTPSGLSTQSFQTWFSADPAVRDHVMQYVVGCAVYAGETRSFTDPNTNITYTWEGALGLAPGWASGMQATPEELQVVSACMAAHANKFGIHVIIALLGMDGGGYPIPYTSQELLDYDVTEACFFGNLFDGSTGTFGANDGLALTSSQSTSRVCGLPDTGGASQCSPMAYVGSCSQYCVKDGTGTFYTSCTYNGVTYRPITTRIARTAIYTCGDGVCQGTESCGTGTTPDSCAADCGACP
jgi:hypothetical protein